MVGIQVQLPCRRADRGARRGARLQRPVVQHRLDEDEAPRVACPRRRSGEEPPPREEGGPAVGRGREDVGERRHGALKAAQPRLAAADALQRGQQAGHHAAETRVCGQGTEKGLRRDELLRRRLYLGERQQEQPVAFKETAALRLPRAADMTRVLLEPRRQRGGRGVGQFRRRGVDDGDDRVDVLGKGGVECDPVPPPLQLRGDQLGRVGGDGEVARRVDERGRRHDQAEQQDGPGPAAARRDDAATERRRAGHSGT